VYQDQSVPVLLLKQHKIIQIVHVNPIIHVVKSSFINIRILASNRLLYPILPYFQASHPVKTKPVPSASVWIDRCATLTIPLLDCCSFALCSSVLCEWFHRLHLETTNSFWSFLSFPRILQLQEEPLIFSWLWSSGRVGAVLCYSICWLLCYLHQV